MKSIVVLALFAIGTSGVLMASVPEIDPASGGSALALLVGALVLIQGRRRK